jgi:REP element-mobilizing transposase RayT
MESDIDHMHLLIDYDPILSISVMVRHLKQVSSTDYRYMENVREISKNTILETQETQEFLDKRIFCF